MKENSIKIHPCGEIPNKVSNKYYHGTENDIRQKTSCTENTLKCDSGILSKQTALKTSNNDIMFIFEECDVAVHVLSVVMFQERPLPFHWSDRAAILDTVLFQFNMGKYIKYKSVSPHF